MTPQIMIQENYQYINLHSLKENTLDNTDVQKEIMELFLNLIDEYLEVLNQELPNKNWCALFEATHKIKPNISMFGIESLQSIIIQLDSDFRNKQNLDTVDDLVSSCIEIFNEVKAEIVTELKSMKND